MAKQKVSKAAPAANGSARTGNGKPQSPASTVKLTNVEKVALERSGYDLMYPPDEKVPSISCPNFPALGKLTAARFLEWVLENPDGVISLPTGKTPEHFIKDVQHFVRTWDKKETQQALEEIGLATAQQARACRAALRADRRVLPDRHQAAQQLPLLRTTSTTSAASAWTPRAGLFINPNKIGIPSGKKICRTSFRT